MSLYSINGIVVHIAKSHHRNDWKEARMVNSVQGYWERRTMEAIKIKGLHLPSVWNPVFDLT